MAYTKAWYPKDRIIIYIWKSGGYKSSMIGLGNLFNVLPRECANKPVNTMESRYKEPY